MSLNYGGIIRNPVEFYGPLYGIKDKDPELAAKFGRALLWMQAALGLPDDILEKEEGMMRQNNIEGEATWAGARAKGLAFRTEEMQGLKGILFGSVALTFLVLVLDL